VLCLVTTAYVFYNLRSATDAYWMLPMMGFAQLAVFAGYSIYFPELFPTRLRGTGVGEGHAEAEAELDELVLDLVERLLAEVAVLEHLRLGLHGELADGGDVGVVEAVGGAHREFDLVDRHVEQLLERGVLLAGFGRRFLEVHGVSRRS
jgi:hypothetical protein